MPLNSDLTNKLRDFLKGTLSLPEYRMAMMRVRLEKLESMPAGDKNFVYEFETRYAQLTAGAVSEYTFKQLLTYAAACEYPGNSNRVTEIYLLSEMPPVRVETTVATGSYSENCELVPA